MESDVLPDPLRCPVVLVPVLFFFTVPLLPAYPTPHPLIAAYSPSDSISDFADSGHCVVNSFFSFPILFIFVARPSPSRSHSPSLNVPIFYFLIQAPTVESSRLIVPSFGFNPSAELLLSGRRAFPSPASSFSAFPTGGLKSSSPFLLLIPDLFRPSSPIVFRLADTHFKLPPLLSLFFPLVSIFSAAPNFSIP